MSVISSLSANLGYSTFYLSYACLFVCLFVCLSFVVLLSFTLPLFLLKMFPSRLQEWIEYCKFELKVPKAWRVKLPFAFDRRNFYMLDLDVCNSGPFTLIVHIKACLNKIFSYILSATHEKHHLTKKMMASQVVPEPCSPKIYSLSLCSHVNYS